MSKTETPKRKVRICAGTIPMSVRTMLMEARAMTSSQGRSGATKGCELRDQSSQEKTRCN